MVDTPTSETRRYWLGRYAVDLPGFWAEASSANRGRLHVLNSIMGHNVTFDVVVVPGGGETQADEYLASAAETLGDGKAEITNEDHKGQPFRGLRIRQPKGLSEDPEAFVEHYTTVYDGDMIAFSLGILGPISAAVAGVRHLMFTIVYAALIRSASAR